MLTWEEWQEKSRSSLTAAQILLEHDHPVEAASRSYYAAYQMVTAVLVKLKLSPRDAFGNWAHLETQNMKVKTTDTQNNGLSKVQLKTFERFRRKLEERVPDYSLTWVHPYNETIIEVGFEPQKKMTYRKTRQAGKLAIELQDETGVLIILR